MLSDEDLAAVCDAASVVPEAVWHNDDKVAHGQAILDQLHAAGYTVVRLDESSVLPYDGDRFVPFEENPERHVYTTGAIKDNRSKPRVDLLPSLPLIEIAKVLTYGARKYKPHNWRYGLPWGDTYASMQRHLMAWINREDIDPETGISHLAHAGCQLLFLLEYELRGTGTDDRWNQASACKTEIPNNLSEPAAAAENSMGCPDCGMPWTDHVRGT